MKTGWPGWYLVSFWSLSNCFGILSASTMNLSHILVPPYSASPQLPTFLSRSPEFSTLLGPLVQISTPRAGALPQVWGGSHPFHFPHLRELLYNPLNFRELFAVVARHVRKIKPKWTSNCWYFRQGKQGKIETISWICRKLQGDLRSHLVSTFCACFWRTWISRRMTPTWEFAHQRVSGPNSR